MMRTTVHIFTFHDHLFQIVSVSAPATGTKYYVEDEYETQIELDDPTNLKQVREACGSILQRYREEMSMPGAKPS